MTVDELLAAARARLERVTPAEARDALAAGACLVDIRGDAQVARDGVIPGARLIPRNALEWRADPACAARDPELATAARVILICDEGYQSSLAAATLQELGHAGATDVIGGFQAWRAAGLPVERR